MSNLMAFFHDQLSHRQYRALQRLLLMLRIAWQVTLAVLGVRARP